MLKISLRTAVRKEYEWMKKKDGAGRSTNLPSAYVLLQRKHYEIEWERYRVTNKLPPDYIYLMYIEDQRSSWNNSAMHKCKMSMCSYIRLYIKWKVQKSIKTVLFSISMFLTKSNSKLRSIWLCNMILLFITLTSDLCK